MDMKNVKWVTNHVASSFSSASATTGATGTYFDYQITPQTSESPDMMVITQIACVTTPQTSASSLYPFNISCDISNQVFGALLFPYNNNGTAVCDYFVSNPQTKIMIYKPLTNTIRFTISNIGLLYTAPSINSIMICFDLIKYK